MSKYPKLCIVYIVQELIIAITLSMTVIMKPTKLTEFP
jgi:hypothetical protein